MLATKNEDIFEKETDEGESTIKPYEVDCLPNDYNISVIMDLIQRGYLKVPSFQRNYVWEKDMASKFIESIIIGLPIPQIFLFEQNRNDFLVIDGQQRLVTIYLFKNKRFPKNDKGRSIIRQYLSMGKGIPSADLSGNNFEEFNLKLPSISKDLNPLNGKNYETLPTSKEFDFKASFDFNRTIRTITIRQIAPDDNYSSMFEIFSRLNSGGVTLRPQEIRMSLFYSPFYDKILELNRFSEWRSYLGKKEPDLHLNEAEVIIRAFAMYEMYEDYQSPMRIFLNKFSGAARNFDQKKIDDLAKIFHDFWDSCKSLGKDSFKNEKGKFVISLFEAVFVAACREISNNGLNGRKISYDSFIKLKQDKEFMAASQQRTAQTAHVKTRINKAIEYIILQ